MGTVRFWAPDLIMIFNFHLKNNYLKQTNKNIKNVLRACLFRILWWEATVVCENCNFHEFFSKFKGGLLIAYISFDTS